MKTVIFVLTLSGLSVLSANIFREYHYVKGKKTWAEAQSYCREKFTDLATVENQVDNDRLLNVLHDLGKYAWIGLHDDMKRWEWTQRNAVNSMFRRWQAARPKFKSQDESCVAMSTKGLWHDVACSTQRSAICYDRGKPKYIFVKKPRKWHEAKKHCRTKYTDLVTVSSRAQNDRISSLISQWSWIGLHRKTWAHWSDQTPSTFANWNQPRPNRNRGPMKSCAAVNTTTGTWWDVNCGTKNDFICQYVSPHRYKTFKLKFHSEADLIDAAVQQQILEQLHAKLEKRGLADFKLRWIETDGQIFHKEPKRKKEEVPGG